MRTLPFINMLVTVVLITKWYDLAMARISILDLKKTCTWCSACIVLYMILVNSGVCESQRLYLTTGNSPKTAIFGQTGTNTSQSQTITRRDNPSIQQPDYSPAQADSHKHTLNEEPRDLSAFFAIGIAINIIMASIFAWWFSKEWRRSADKKQTTDQ